MDFDPFGELGGSTPESDSAKRVREWRWNGVLYDLVRFKWKQGPYTLSSVGPGGKLRAVDMPIGEDALAEWATMTDREASERAEEVLTNLGGKKPP